MRLQGGVPGRFSYLLAQAKAITPGGDLGLGPALAERIVTLYAGRVRVANVRGVGSGSWSGSERRKTR